MLYNEWFWNILSYCFRYLNFPAKNGQKYTFEKRERSPFHPFHSSRIIVICTKVLFLVGFQPLWYILWWMSICSFCQKNSRCIALDSTSLMHFMVDEYLQFLNINNYSQMARFFLTYSSSFSRLKHLFSLMQFIPKSFMFLMFIQFHSWNTELTDFLKGLHSGCSLKNCDQIFLDGWKFRQKYDWWRLNSHIKTIYTCFTWCCSSFLFLIGHKIQKWYDHPRNSFFPNIMISTTLFLQI